MSKRTMRTWRRGEAAQGGRVEQKVAERHETQGSNEARSCRDVLLQAHSLGSTLLWGHATSKAPTASPQKLNKRA